MSLHIQFFFRKTQRQSTPTQVVFLADHHGYWLVWFCKNWINVSPKIEICVFFLVLGKDLPCLIIGILDICNGTDNPLNLCPSKEKNMSTLSWDDG